MGKNKQIKATDMLDFLKKLFGRNKEQKPNKMGELVELCKDNSSDAYDRLWSDEELLKCYLEPGRVESYLHVVRYALSKGCGKKVVDIGFGSGDFLKILSRVTEPTKGEVKIRGRVGSLLEVGTGFHPELTGRENIFLNGAILGMRKDEIKKKFCLRATS